MSWTLPNWLIDLLGIANGDGVVWRLEVTWDWAPWVTLLFLVFAVVWVATLYARETSNAGKTYRAFLVALRLAVIGIVLVMLAELTLTAKRTAPPSLAIVVDRSASMNTADHYDDLPPTFREPSDDASPGKPTRLNLAKQLLSRDDARALRDLARDYDLNLYFAAGGLQEQPGGIDEFTDAIHELSADSPDSHVSRLGGAVRRVLAESTAALPAAVVLLTDGITTDGPTLRDAADDARRKAVPLILLGLGSDFPPRDVEITDVLVDDVVFVDDLVRFQVGVKSRGLEGQSAQVTLRNEQDGEPLATETVLLGPTGESQTVWLLHRATEPGDVNLVVEVTAGKDDVNPENNRKRVEINVRDEKIRVLLAAARPSYEFRFLKTLLDRERTISLATYLRDADLAYAEQDRSAIRSLPLGEEAILEYDVVILSDLDPAFVPRSTWRALLGAVSEHGRGLVMVAGPRFLPWEYGRIPEAATLLPILLARVVTPLGLDVTEDGFRPQLTSTGLRAPSMQLGATFDESRRTWQELPPLYWFAESAGAKPAAQVLLEHPTRTGNDGRNLPIICQQFLGRGNVLYHATDETWRWRLGIGDVYFARYWVQSIRELARAKLRSAGDVELDVDRPEYRPGDAVRLRARFAGQPSLTGESGRVTVLLEGEQLGRKTVTLDPVATSRDTFEAVVTDLPPGRYEALLVEPASQENASKATFSVIRPATEAERLEMDRAELVAAAEISRGKFYTISQADELFADLPRGRRVPVEDLPPRPIWNQWWMMLLLVSLVTSEWLLRKFRGMM